MKDSSKLDVRFSEIFQPIFYWGFGVFELLLVLYTMYLELLTGTGLSLVSTILPLSVAIAVIWAVLSVLITLAVLRLKKRK